MKASIEYCVVWNYYPHAARVADLIKNEFSIETELIKGGGGIFDVKLDGELIYSKSQTGFFPTDDDIREILKKWEVWGIFEL